MLPIISESAEKQETDNYSKPKCCSTFFGRVITVLKTVAIAFLTAPVGAIAMQPSVRKVIDYTTFRPYITRFIRPGEQSVLKGTVTCSTYSMLGTVNSCGKYATDLLRTLVLNKKIDFETPMQENGYSEKHVADGVTHTLKVRIHPQYAENYKKAVLYIEQTFFADVKSPLELDAETTIAYILDIHRILYTGIMKAEEIRPGQLRIGTKYFGSEDKLPLYEANAKVNLSKPEKQLYAKMIAALRQKGLLFINTQEEKDIWRKVGLEFAPPPEKVDREIREFAQAVVDLFAAKVDPIEIAAYVQTHLARIFPVTIGTGKISRLLLNAILVRYAGISPVVFRSKEMYNQAVSKAANMLDHKLFATYLRETVIPGTLQNLPTLRQMELMPHYLTQFPEDAPLYLHAGLKYSVDGKSSHTLKSTKKTAPVQTYVDPRNTHNVAVLFEENNNPQCHTPQNPQTVVNAKNAYRAAEERILQNPAAFVEGIDTTIRDIKYIYSLLEPENRNGDYRTNQRLLATTLIKSDAKKRLTSAEFALFEKSDREVMRGQQTRGFTAAELDAWKKAGAYIPPQAKEIDSEMLTLAAELQLLIEKADNVEDFIQIAAHAHTGIARILPYSKSSGKLARLILNAILGRFAGIKPVIFPDKMRYLDMTNEAVKTNTLAFYTFLQYEVLLQQDELYALNSKD